MTKLVHFVLLLSGLSIATAFAGTPSENGTAENRIYKSPDEVVNFSIERGTGEVKLHVVIKDVSLIDHVVIEKSMETPDYYSDCKYISCIAPKLSGIFNEVD